MEQVYNSIKVHYNVFFLYFNGFINFRNVQISIAIFEKIVKL